MDLMTIVGFVAGGGIFLWSIQQTGITSVFMNPHGVVIVLGGTFCATMVNTSFSGMVQGLRSIFMIFRNQDLPSSEECVRILVQMAETARREGGLLAVQNADPRFADGF